MKKSQKKNGDTPQNDVSLTSPDDNANDSNKFEGTQENPGTRPHLSPSGEKGRGGHEKTCPPKKSCPPYNTDNIAKNGRGHEGHEKSGGGRKNFCRPLGR